MCKHRIENIQRRRNLLSPSVGFFASVLILIGVMAWLRLSLSIALVIFSMAMVLLINGDLPFRHLVEGSFGYLNLILALFAGAFFGQAMRMSRAADAFGNAVIRWCGHRQLVVVVVAAVLLFVAGAMVGIAGVAVLATGVFVVPMLKRLGMSNERVAAFIALLSTCGMIAPPVNVPAMAIADGVNMPYANFEYALFILAIIPALITIALFSRSKILTPQNKPTLEEKTESTVEGRMELSVAILGLVLTLGFWLLQRSLPAYVIDPAVPLVLVVGSLVALIRLNKHSLRQLMDATFSGTPLILAGVLVAVGITVQIMTLTGVRGWLVITALSFPEALLYVELLMLPLFGSVLTSMGTANVLGVPLAFSFIHQDMIINVAALSAISAISEFMPPTAIATALSLYVVGGQASLFKTLRYCLIPVASIFIIAVLMLVFATQLSPFISVA